MRERYIIHHRICINIICTSYLYTYRGLSFLWPQYHPNVRHSNIQLSYIWHLQMSKNFLLFPVNLFVLTLVHLKSTQNTSSMKRLTMNSDSHFQKRVKRLWQIHYFTQHIYSNIKSAQSILDAAMEMGFIFA